MEILLTQHHPHLGQLIGEEIKEQIKHSRQLLCPRDVARREDAHGTQVRRRERSIRQHDNATWHNGSARETCALRSKLVEKGRLKIVGAVSKASRRDGRKEKAVSGTDGRGHVKQLERHVQEWASSPEAQGSALFRELKIPWHITQILSLGSVYVLVSTFSDPWLNISHHLVLLLFMYQEMAHLLLSCLFSTVEFLSILLQRSPLYETKALGNSFTL